jgi:3-keto-5-aminohexanoate cleavage enzyme
MPYPAHPLTPFPPLIVNVALTGLTTTRDRVPHVPLAPDEIVDDAERCFAAGARIVHLHARDGAGSPLWRREAYRDMVLEIRERCPGVIVCITTSGREDPLIDHRADVLGLDGAARPDLASLTLGSVNFTSGPSVTSIADVEELARRMQAAGVVPELEIFDLGMAHLAHRLLARGLLGPVLTANLMLGFPNGAAADARSLLSLRDALPAGTTWAAAGFGAFQVVTTALAAAIGGHVRTGLEDNAYLDHQLRTPATNARLVAQAVAHAQLLGRPVATPAEARELLGLRSPRPAAAHL